MQYEITVNDLAVGEQIDDGYILLARKLLKSPTWEALTAEQRVVMITCLLLANHKHGKWWDKYNKQFVEVKRGQFVTSREHLCKACGKGMTQQKLRTTLATLENMKFLTKQSTKLYSLVTVANYDFYQTASNYSTKQPTNNQPTSNQPPTTNKNDKNDKNEKKKDKKIMYADFVSMTEAEHQKLVDKMGTDATASFIDRLNLYKGSTGKKYSSDYMTILSWERKDADKKGGPPGGQAQPASSQLTAKPKGKFDHLYITED